MATGARTTVVDVVCGIVEAHPAIGAVTLFRYEVRPTFEDVKKKERLTLAEEIDRRFRHGGKLEFRNLDREELTKSRLLQEITGLPAGSALAIASMTTVPAVAAMHIPMIDFECCHSPEAERFLISALRRVDSAGGVLVETERSYHFYGNSLLDQREWYGFIGRCLMLKGYVDVRYCGHCLLDGFSALRIAGGRIPANVPRVTSLIERS